MNTKPEEAQQNADAAPERIDSGFAVKAINFILFQSVWLITVIGAARGLTWPGIIAIATFTIIHGYTAPKPLRDFQLLVIAVVIGFICDSVIVSSGFLQVTTTFPLEAIAPLWMLVLWANLALAINHCLGWLHHREWLAAAFGAIGGPVAYLGGAALGAGQFNTNQLIAAIPLAILWAILTPALFRIAGVIEKRIHNDQ